MKLNKINISGLLWTFLAFSLSFSAFGQRLNVRDFGARGNGKTDDTAAIQKALNQAEKLRAKQERIYVNNGGQIVSWGLYDAPSCELVFPKGTYKISRTLVGNKAVVITGEAGSVIQMTDQQKPLLYLDRAFRYKISNLTFRGGREQIYFWTKNQDTAQILIENCRFENSLGFAVRTESWATAPHARGGRPVSPFEVIWKNGLPTLKPRPEPPVTVFYNSTFLRLRECKFINCAGALQGRPDGLAVRKCSFHSTLPQKLPIWEGIPILSMSDVEMTANLPKGYPYGWFDFDKVPIFCVELVRVTAKSTSQYGAPLVRDNKPSREKSTLNNDNLVLEDCRASVAGGTSNALIEFPQFEVTQLTVRRCREYNGKPINLVHFHKPPKSDKDLLLACHGKKNVPIPQVNLSHAWVLEKNGHEIRNNIPRRLRKFIVAPIPQKVMAKFPNVDSTLKPADLSHREIFNAADYGLDMKPSDNDTDKLEALLYAASKSQAPLILLPGRVIKVTRPLTLPNNAVIHSQGRTFLSCWARDEFDMFRAIGNVQLEFSGITFVGGHRAIAVEGTGNVLVKNCFFYDNFGIETRQTGDELLRLEVIDSLFWTQLGVDNYGGEARIIDTWLAIAPTLPTGAYLLNEGGTMILNNVLGVPVIFLGSRKYWTRGKDLFWIKNTGITRSRFTRFGGEFGGIPALDNYGSGKALLEGQYAHFFNGYSCRALFRNHDRDGTVVIREMTSLYGIVPSKLYDGVLPKKLYISGLLHPDMLKFASKKSFMKQVGLR